MPAQTASNQIRELQGLRALAVMMVVIGHIHQADFRFMAPSLLGDYAYFGYAGVDLFFVISGFIIHWLYRGHDKPDAAYFLKRLNRIYPLYWIFTLAAIAGYAVMGDALTSDLASLDVWQSFTLAPANQPPILQVGWTLTHELYFYLVYGLVLVLPRRFRLWAFLAWGAATLAYMTVRPGSMGPWLQIALSPFNLLFLAGIALAALIKRLPQGRWPLLGLALAATALGLWWLNSHAVPGLSDQRVRILMVGPFAVFTVAAVLAWKPAIPDFGIKLGDWSYSIYLSHILAIGVLSRLVPAVLGTGLDATLVFYAVSLIAVIILGWVSHRLLERPLLKLGRGLIRRT